MSSPDLNLCLSTWIEATASGLTLGAGREDAESWPALVNASILIKRIAILMRTEISRTSDDYTMCEPLSVVSANLDRLAEADVRLAFIRT
jgi:hypothetical protein